MKSIKKFLKHLFCRHHWYYSGYIHKIDENTSTRYLMRKYECQKCGKVIWIDGRYDSFLRGEKKGEYITQSCNNKTLDKFLKHLIKEFERDDTVVSHKNIPFVISVLWQKFSYADGRELADFIDDLEKYADYIISINKPQNDYSGICDIEISLLKYIEDDYDNYDSPNYNYVINIEHDERLWGYCQCSPEDEDYREDKHCCGHGCDWHAPHLILNKVFVVTSHNWNGDEHDFWEFEDNFYKSELELNEQNEKIKKEEEIKRLRELIENSKERLKELESNYEV